MTEPQPPGRRRNPWFRAGLQAQLDQRRTDIESQMRAARTQFDQTQERINARTGRNLLFAILFGLLLGAILLLSLLVVKWLFVLLAAALVAFASAELASALRHAGRNVPRAASIIAGVGVLPLAYVYGGAGQWWGAIGGVVFVSLWRLGEYAVRPVTRHGMRALGRDLGAGVLIQLYVALLAGCAVALTAEDGGEWWTLAFLITVVCVDVGAYASGLAFGKHPMAPRVSPKKTWEGFAGSVVAAVLGGILLTVFMLGREWWVGLVLGAVLVVTATMGDLAESLIKRNLGIKDMSSWLPGHGGFLDRLDSILPSAAAAQALFLLLR